MQEVELSATYNNDDDDYDYDDQNGRLFTFATRIRKFGDVNLYTVTINSNVLVLVIRI